jgi:hypothetical protein
VPHVSNLALAVFIDLVTVPACTILLLKFGRLGHSHPAAIYLVFHITTFTVRSIGVLTGAPTLFSTFGPAYSPVTPDEIARALFTADIALVVMTLAWLRAAKVDRAINARPTTTNKPFRELSSEHLWRVVALAFPIGMISLVLLDRIPVFHTTGGNFATTSSWFVILQLWPGLSLLALMYRYGFRWWLSVPMGVYLLIMAVQGFDRFRVVIPVLLIVQIYLDRHNMRWPTARAGVALIALAVLFYPLKDIGNLTASGASPGDVVANASQQLGEVFTGSHPDQQFEDEYASALTLIDENGKFYYGTVYAPLVTLPIPRQWWPDKPSTADYLNDFSRPWRPMHEMGMIVTILGEAYANFGYLGIVLVPGLVAYFLGLAYFAAYRRPYLSLARFAYLLIAANLIQVWRDGLQSLVLFTLVNMMPLMILIALHYLLPPERFHGRHLLSDLSPDRQRAPHTPQIQQLHGPG